MAELDDDPIIRDMAARLLLDPAATGRVEALVAGRLDPTFMHQAQEEYRRRAGRDVHLDSPAAPGLALVAVLKRARAAL